MRTEAEIRKAMKYLKFGSKLAVTLPKDYPHVDTIAQMVGSFTAAVDVLQWALKEPSGFDSIYPRIEALVKNGGEGFQKLVDEIAEDD